MTSERENILVTYDGSEVSKAAFGPAALLAKRLGAGIVLIRVYHAPVEIWSHPETEHRESELARLTASWQQDLEAVGAEFAKNEGVEVESHARLLGQRWNVAGEILAAADEFEVLLIVMATHGESGIRRVFVGSVTQEVIAESTRPVTLIRSGKDAG